MKIGDQTCANSCERVAYQIEIRRLKAEITKHEVFTDLLHKEKESYREENERLRQNVLDMEDLLRWQRGKQ